MLEVIFRRSLQAIGVVLALSFVSFVGVYKIGDPVQLLAHEAASETEIEAAAARLGLDRPFHEQYLTYIARLASADFGTSFVSSRPVIDVIMERLPATIELTLVAFLLSVALGIPLGILAGLYPERLLGRSIMSVSILGFSLPNFWFGMMLILVLSVELGVLPSIGRGETDQLGSVSSALFTRDGWAHLIMPGLMLSLASISLIIRLVSAGMREVLLLDYIKFARLKGLHEGRVVLLHGLKNVMIPVVTVLGLELGSLLAGSIVTETVFAYPGIGKLLIDSINNLDRPVIVAYLTLIVVFFVIINLVVDLLYTLLDPRARRTIR